VREVCSRSAVSVGVRHENSSAIDYGIISKCLDMTQMRPTLEIDDEDRICLPLDADLSPALSLDRARDTGSEFVALLVGNSTNGNALSPGLEDREIRGQGMSPQTHTVWI
jgi:hypothetical protein